MARIFVLDDMDARHQVIARRFPDAERVHAWNFLEAVAALTTGRFDLMLLDHDLGEEFTGLHVAERIAALRSDWLPLEAVIHSHNPVGAERMFHILESAGIHTRLEPFMSEGVRRPDEPSRIPASFEKRMEAFLDACREQPPCRHGSAGKCSFLRGAEDELDRRFEQSGSPIPAVRSFVAIR